MTYPGRPMVSVQRRGAGDAAQAHLVWGALVDPDVVVAPWSAELTAVGVEVLLASAYTDRPMEIERIGVTGIERHGLAGAPDGAMAVLRLSHASNHPPSVTAAGRPTLGRDGDLWGALRSAGVVPADPVRAVLDAVAAEEGSRLGTFSDHLTDPNQVEDFWCCIFHLSCCGAVVPWPQE